MKGSQSVQWDILLGILGAPVISALNGWILVTVSSPLDPGGEFLSCDKDCSNDT